MSIILLLVLFIGVLFAWYFLYIRYHSKTNYRNNKKTNIYRWMSISKKERQAYDEYDKKVAFDKRKTLLKQIRKEYINLSKSE